MSEPTYEKTELFLPVDIFHFRQRIPDVASEQHAHNISGEDYKGGNVRPPSSALVYEVYRTEMNVLSDIIK